MRKAFRDITAIKQYESDLKIKNRELSALNSIASVLTHSLDTRLVITSVVKKFSDIFGMRDGGVFLSDEERQELACYLTQRKLPIGDNTPGLVLTSGQVFTASDLNRDGRETMAWLSSDVRSCCCAPIRGKEKTLGVLYLVSDEKHLFTNEEKDILSAVGDMVGIALENTRLYETINALYEYQRGRRRMEMGNL